MERVKLLFVVLLLVIALGFLMISVRSTTIADQGDDGFTQLPTQKVTSAPDWTLTDVRTGQPINLRAETRQHPVVFSFWATWCGPCREELPHLQRVFARYRGRVSFYGINANDPPPKMMAFGKRLGLTFPLLVDASHEVSAHYGAEQIPLLIVVDTHGNVRAVSSGYGGGGDLEAGLSQFLDTLLAEPASGGANTHE